MRRGILLLAGTLLLGAAVLVVDTWRRSRALDRRAERLEATEGSLAGIPERRIEWLLRVEDPAFRSHHGVDLTTPGAGWTTITQGLVKIHFPGPYQGPVGKPLQSVRALVLDAAVSKDRQLTLLFHTAYLGAADSGPLVGFPAAAEAFYGRSLPELSDLEFLGLVAMLVGPDRFHPVAHPVDHADRVRRIRALVAGRCAPAGWRDVYLEGCAGG